MSLTNSYNYPLYLDETLHFEWVESLVFRRTEIQSLTTSTSHRTEAPRGGVPDDVFATTIASTTIACHSSTAAAAASDLHEHVQLCIRLDLR